MPRYRNGEVPLSELVHLGGEHYLPRGTATRWRWMVDTCLAKYGVQLRITPGYNAYRPLWVQRDYKRLLGKWAAAPGHSSHGLTYKGRDFAAIDVQNWADVGWGRFAALCRMAGFKTNFVSPQELWHIGDPDPYSVPGIQISAVSGRMPREWDEMASKEEIGAVVREVLQERSPGGVSLVPLTDGRLVLVSGVTGKSVHVQNTRDAGLIQRALQNYGRDKMYAAEVETVAKYLAEVAPDAAG